MTFYLKYLLYVFRRAPETPLDYVPPIRGHRLNDQVPHLGKLQPRLRTLHSFLCMCVWESFSRHSKIKHSNYSSLGINYGHFFSRPNLVASVQKRAKRQKTAGNRCSDCGPKINKLESLTMTSYR